MAADLLPLPCQCGSDATIRDGDDEPGEIWCGCLTCDAGVSATPTRSGVDARAAAITTWNTLIRTMGVRDAN